MSTCSRYVHMSWLIQAASMSYVAPAPAYAAPVPSYTAPAMAAPAMMVAQLARVNNAPTVRDS
eukprot:4380758-Amphidinium_carterae.2